MWPFKRKTAPNQPRRSTQYDVLVPPDRVPVPWSDDISDLSVMRHHTIRVLCGMFMGRHTDCQSPHPFCGSATHSNPGRLIAQPINQVDNNDQPVLAIYLCRATESIITAEDEQITPFDGAVSLKHLDNIPYRKMVVNPNADGTYTALYGQILNPVEGNYATGSLDPANEIRHLLCNPEPRHTKWEYYERQIPDGDTIPEYRCLIVHGECWVVEADPEHGIAQQVAGLTITDDPEHNFGIHSRPNARYTTTPDDDSELAKVIRENCPIIGVGKG